MEKTLLTKSCQTSGAILKIQEPPESGWEKDGWHHSSGEVGLSSMPTLPNSLETGAVNSGASLPLHVMTVSGHPPNVLTGGIGAR